MRVCPYCGTLPDPVVLTRADDAPVNPSGTVSATGSPEHADDCPYFVAPTMARRLDPHSGLGAGVGSGAGRSGFERYGRTRTSFTPT